jgi:hypothetical protein
LVVSIASTERQLLEFVLEQVGVGKITRKRIACDRHSPSFCHSITSVQALSLLQQIFPLLHSYKRRRAELALACYRLMTPRNGKYTAELLAARVDFERSLLALKPGCCPRGP